MQEVHGLSWCTGQESDDGQLINVGNFVWLKQQRTTLSDVMFVSISTQLMFCPLVGCRTASGMF